MRANFFRGKAALIIVTLLLHAGRPYSAEAWRKIDEGLSLGEYHSRGEPEGARPDITVLKIDPKFYSLRLFSASEHGGERLAAREWAARYGLAAVVNAGMYQTDGLTSVGFMKNFGHVNNPRLNPFKAVLAFNRLDESVPEVQIIDRECVRFEDVKPHYQTFVQSIRMISCRRENVWSPQGGRWNMVALGIDAAGSILFICMESPLPVHEFIDVLLALPLSLKGAMYLEGGPEASFYLSVKGESIEKNGGSAPQNGGPSGFSWPIPNIIGIARK